MIKYLGSKKKLLPQIVEAIKKENPKTVIDLFSGTSRVGHALQNEGIKVISNDMNNYAHVIATTYVQADPASETAAKARTIIDQLNKIPAKKEAGWFTQTYCIDSMFFQEKNGLKIEAIREEIEKLCPTRSELKSILLSSLMEAADRIDSTCGIQMAYLKSWAKRSFKDLDLRMPNMSKGVGSAILGDAKDSAKISADLTYLDPPYNQHNYLGNYHIWETLCLWDNPDIYGVAKKRVDVRTKKSNFNSKRKILEEFQIVIQNLSSPKAMVSFSNEGYLSKNQIVQVLESKFSNVSVLEIPYQRYVGAKIGIHNKDGVKVGVSTHTENVELLFLAK